MKLQPKIVAALEATGLPWGFEHGRGHLKIRLNGKLVGVMSANGKEGAYNATRNVVTQIRHAAKEMAR